MSSTKELMDDLQATMRKTALLSKAIHSHVVEGPMDARHTTASMSLGVLLSKAVDIKQDIRTLVYALELAEHQYGEWRHVLERYTELEEEGEQSEASSG